MGITMFISMDDGMSMPPPDTNQAQASRVVTHSPPAITARSCRAADSSTPLARSFYSPGLVWALRNSVHRPVGRHVEHADMTVTVAPVERDWALAPSTTTDELCFVVFEAIGQHHSGAMRFA